MDNSQKDHLKAYGIAYWILTFDKEVEWLLNYRGGSFMVDNIDKFENLEFEIEINDPNSTAKTVKEKFYCIVATKQRPLDIK